MFFNKYFRSKHYGARFFVAATSESFDTTIHASQVFHQKPRSTTFPQPARSTSFRQQPRPTTFEQ